MTNNQDRERLLTELAMAAHEQDEENQNRMFASVIEYGHLAINSALLISGGSVVVGLAFVGALYASDAKLAAELMASVFVFTVGAILAGAAAGFSYLSQHNYAEASFRKVRAFEHPFVTEKPEAKPFREAGDFWRRFAIFSVVAAFVSVIVGVAVAWRVL